LDAGYRIQVTGCSFQDWEPPNGQAQGLRCSLLPRWEDSIPSRSQLLTLNKILCLNVFWCIDRLVTVRNADMIVVVQRGFIVKKGAHSQLIVNLSEAYSQLIRLQKMHQSKEQYINDPDQMDIHLHDCKQLAGLVVKSHLLDDL
jgi:hypothetical protein